QRRLRRHSRRQPRRARRENRPAPVARSDRREHGRLAHQLRGRRPPVRCDRGREYGVCLRAAGGRSMMRHTLKYLVVLVTVALAVATPASAQQYSARQTGDIVQLSDAKTDTKVSIVPSVGNIAFELSVKGQNVLRWPYGSVEEFKSKPTMSGIPFLGP